MNRGIFTISLDYELHWGVFDSKKLETYEKNIENESTSAIKMLERFEKFDIHATWAVVGFMFASNQAELVKIKKNIHLPKYENSRYNSYYLIDNNVTIFRKPYLYFAPEVVSRIVNSSGQELATHTFSHMYCKESGLTLQAFESDINAALEIAKKFNAEIKTIIFPRNQYTNDFLEKCKNLGITNFRGVESSFMYQTESRDKTSYFNKLLRFSDSFLPISGNNTYSLAEIQKRSNIITDIPSSRFLRPYSKNLALFDNLKLNRIKNQMKYAAVNSKLFHLWWHPHNFGNDLNRNLLFLDRILEYYRFLNSTYGMTSLNMAEVGKIVNNGL